MLSVWDCFDCTWSQKKREIIPSTDLWLHLQIEIRPVETRPGQLRILQLQQVTNILENRDKMIENFKVPLAEL